MIRHSILGRSIIVAATAVSAAFVGAPLANAGDAVHYQNGVAHEVIIDTTHVLVLTDGSKTSVDLAVDLAAAGLAQSLTPVGTSSTSFDVAVSAATPEVIEAIARQPGVRSAHPVIRFRAGGQAFGLTSNLFVKFRSDVSVAARAAFASDYDLALQRDITAELGLNDVAVYEASGGDALARVSALYSDHRLADWHAHADLIPPRITAQSNPTDEFFDLQWHLSNNGNFPGSVHADIGALEAWETTMGEDVRVGMHDDGCEVTHEDLIPNHLGFSQAGGGGPIGLGGGHGTAVMGLMVAENNAIGVSGVAPNAEFMATSWSGGFANDAAAFAHAMNNDIDVHNNSWGYAFGLMPDVTVEAIQNIANSGREGKGIVVMFASGNSGVELEAGDDLSTLPEVIQVGATGQSDVIASYSNYGVTQDIMGPTLGDDGVGLATTDIMGSFGYNDGNSLFDIQGAPNYTQNFGGTSGASPVVTGVAALVVGTNPNLNRVQVRSLLIHTAERVAPIDADYGQTTRFSLRYGFGRVDAAAAVEAASASISDNATWPGRVQDVNVQVFEGEDDLESNLSWLPSGMILGGEGDEIATDEEEVVIFYRVPAQEGPDGIQFTPQDGVRYVPCNPNEFDTCILPAPFASPNLAVIYSGPPTSQDGQRRLIENLPLAGNDPEDAQLFAMYALSSNGLYSFARVFDENGDDVDEGGDDGGGGIIVPPPDQGRPIDPELVPDEPGLNDPPSVTATADRTVCDVPCSVDFHGGVFTANDIVDRGWSFGDGVNSSEDSVTHTYDLPGTYNAVFFAMDDDEPNGRISTKLIQISAGLNGDGAAQPGFQTAEIQVLTAAPITAPNAQVRLSVQTTGIGESSNSVSVSYDWDFGDGNMGGGQTSENIYANPGFYSVVVLVTEELSNGQRVQVSASTIVEIEGLSVPVTQSIPLDQTQGTVEDNSGATGADACGLMGVASLTLTLLGLCGIRFHRKRDSVS